MIRIAAYVFKQSRSTDATNAILEALYAAFEALAASPRMGTPRPSLRRGLRSYRFKSYMIFYRVHRQHIEVSRVLSQRQDLTKAFPKRKPRRRR